MTAAHVRDLAAMANALLRPVRRDPAEADPDPDYDLFDVVLVDSVSTSEFNEESFGEEVTDMETEHEGAPETEAPPPPAPSAQGDGDSGDTTATDDAPPTTADDTRG